MKNAFLGFVVYTMMLFGAGAALGAALGLAVAPEHTQETPVCTQESHYITQPYDGGTVHDGRTVYTGECKVYSN